MSLDLSHRLSSLLRGRYIISIIAMIVCITHPEVAQWIVALAGMASSVSAIDALQQGKGSGDGT